MYNLTFVYPCVTSVTVNDDQQAATILAYLLIPHQLYVFWAMSSPIIRNTWMYLQLLILSTNTAASWPAVSVNNIRSCKYGKVLLMMGEDIAQNM